MSKLRRILLIVMSIAGLTFTSATPALAATATPKKCPAAQHSVISKTKTGKKSVKCETTKKSKTHKNAKKSHAKTSSAKAASENKTLAKQNANKVTYKGKGVATAICKDGTDSYASQHRGECSHHGGVAHYL